MTNTNETTAGNGAKIREVVELLARVILPLQEEYPAEYGGGKVPDKDGWLAWIRQVQSYAKSALAAPRRNCDVGTAEEQQARHCAWCRKYGIDGNNKVNCAHQDMCCDLCALRWAQMPYEEGGEQWR